MEGILIKPQIWVAKLRVLEQYSEAQTRRAEAALKEINQEPDKWELIRRNDDGRFLFWVVAHAPEIDPEKRYCLAKPRYQVGETVYVKEAHYRYGRWVKNGLTKTGRQKWAFKADELMVYFDTPTAEVYPTSAKDKTGWFKRSPLFMPEWAARYFITITDVSAERLQEISEENAIAEGCTIMVGVTSGGSMGLASARYAYKEPWNSINKDYPWESNPWVFIYTFKQK